MNRDALESCAEGRRERAENAIGSYKDARVGLLVVGVKTVCGNSMPQRSDCVITSEMSTLLNNR